MMDGSPGESIQDRDGQTSMTGKKYLSHDRVSYDEDKKKLGEWWKHLSIHGASFFFIIPDKKLYSC